MCWLGVLHRVLNGSETICRVRKDPRPTIDDGRSAVYIGCDLAVGVGLDEYDIRRHARYTGHHEAAIRSRGDVVSILEASIWLNRVLPDELAIEIDRKRSELVLGGHAEERVPRSGLAQAECPTWIKHGVGLVPNQLALKVNLSQVGP